MRLSASVGEICADRGADVMPVIEAASSVTIPCQEFGMTASTYCPGSSPASRSDPATRRACLRELGVGKWSPSGDGNSMGIALDP